MLGVPPESPWVHIDQVNSCDGSNGARRVGRPSRLPRDAHFTRAQLPMAPYTQTG
jgi:hypothetical protein